MRADAVSLEVPVKVHGTRMQETASGAASGEPFEEKTSTMIVFPQGGVLKMTTPVAPAQMMVVTNLKSGHDSICRVVKVRAYAQGQSYVEIEFTHRQLGYWGVYFPSDGPEAAENGAPAAPPIPLEVRGEKPAEKPPVEAAAVKPIPKTPTPKPAAGKPDSVFVPLGSQEPVQPAAAATSSRRATPSSGGELVGKPLNLEAAFQSPAEEHGSLANPSSPLKAEIKSNAQALLSFAGAGVPGEVVEVGEADGAPPADPLPVALGRLAAAAPFAKSPTAREAFDGALSSSTFAISGASEPSRAKSKHPAMVAVGAVVLLALAAGAAYHFRMPPFDRPSAAQPNSPTPPPPAAAPASAAAQPRIVEEPAEAPAKTDSAAPTVTANTTPAKADKAPPSAAVVPTRPAPAAAAPAPVASTATGGKVLLRALQAHPTSPKPVRDSAPAETAPEIDAPAADSEAGLSAIAESSPLAPPTEDAQPVRIRVGGELKPPRLLSSVIPVYPAMARDTGIEGEVVIDTTIDKTGRVTGAKVISGPSVLRQAALDAVRQWRYEPSKLNGEPVPVQLTVTLKFHRD